MNGKSARLTAEFGQGFDERNLRHMRAFYSTFPNWNALRSELSWTHYRALLRVDDAAARLWYMNEAATQNWNTRALDRQIGTLYYERLLASEDELLREQELIATQALSTSLDAPVPQPTKGKRKKKAAKP
jgi:hypothetical protein